MGCMKINTINKQCSELSPEEKFDKAIKQMVDEPLTEYSVQKIQAYCSRFCDEIMRHKNLKIGLNVTVDGKSIHITPENIKTLLYLAGLENEAIFCAEDAPSFKSSLGTITMVVSYEDKIDIGYEAWDESVTRSSTLRGRFGSKVTKIKNTQFFLEGKLV